ncbi:hypothetical protein RHMOL_Rhmol04G0179300 [Rhododendron molle]|uniref:Uncharacterized protein n=1 Tax=Rhododendron molle TaxID=49168 RepID=A0ACC0P1J4_RHOML|nr:hypothetical protein RHMOL_Rhmol04G0179300 [Rhododendron molle]
MGDGRVQLNIKVGGKFVGNSVNSYIDGDICYSRVVSFEFSYNNLLEVLFEVGCMPGCTFFYLRPNHTMEDGLFMVSNDADMTEMFIFHDGLGRDIECFVSQPDVENDDEEELGWEGVPPYVENDEDEELGGAGNEWLAKKYVVKINDDPDWKVKAMQNDVRRKWMLDVFEMYIYKAKRKALEMVEGAHEFEDIMPPPYRRKTGRPKKTRRKRAEEAVAEMGTIFKCIKCNQPGHNARTYKALVASTGAEVEESSTSQVSLYLVPYLVVTRETSPCPLIPTGRKGKDVSSEVTRGRDTRRGVLRGIGLSRGRGVAIEVPIGGGRGVARGVTTERVVIRSWASQRGVTLGTRVGRGVAARGGVGRGVVAKGGVSRGKEVVVAARGEVSRGKAVVVAEGEAGQEGKEWLFK